eukprot:ANDGO_01942.mRNA.1 hypothetical protein
MSSRECSLSLFERFDVHVLQVHLISISSTSTAGLDGDNSMTHTLLATPTMHSEACLKQMRNLWKLLLSQKPDVGKLPPLVSSIHEHASTAMTEFELLTIRFGRDPRVLRAFARFLVAVEFDPIRAGAMQEDAMQREEEEGQRRTDGAAKSTVSSKKKGREVNGAVASPLGAQAMRGAREDSCRSDKGAEGCAASTIVSPSRYAAPRRTTFQGQQGDSSSPQVPVHRLSETVETNCDEDYIPRSGSFDSENALAKAETQSTGSSNLKGGASAQTVSAWRARINSSRSTSFSRLRIATVAAICCLALGVIGSYIVEKLLLNSYKLSGATVDTASGTQLAVSVTQYYMRQSSLAYTVANTQNPALFGPSKILSNQLIMKIYISEVAWRMSNLTSPTKSALDAQALSTLLDDHSYSARMFSPSTDTLYAEPIDIRDFVERYSLASTRVGAMASTAFNGTSILVDTSFRFIQDNCESTMFDAMKSLTMKVTNYLLDANSVFQIILIVQVSVSVFLPCALCLFLFWPSLKRFKKERDELFQLFTTVPKSLVRKAYVKVGGRDAASTEAEDLGFGDDAENSMSDSASSARLTYKKDPSRRLATLFIVTSVILLVMMCMFAVQGFLYVRLFAYRANNVIYSGAVRNEAAYIRALSLELIVNDLRSWPRGRAEIRQRLTEGLSNMVRYDLAVRKGSSSLGTSGSDGVDSRLDNLYYQPKCNDSTKFTCWSCTQQLSVFADNVRDWIATPDANLKYSSTALANIMSYGSSLSTGCTATAITYYQDQHDSEVSTMSTLSDVVFGCSVPIVLFMLILLLIALQELDADTRRTRMMYLQLPVSFIESNDLILSVVLTAEQTMKDDSLTDAENGGVQEDLKKASRGELVLRVVESEGRLQRVIESSSDGIIELTSDLSNPRIDSFNSVMCTMLNARNSAVIAGRNILEFFPKAEDAEAVRAALKLVDPKHVHS